MNGEMAGYSAHLDSFTRDNLPPKSQWPEFLCELPELKYPARLNCATELLDKPVTRGHGHRSRRVCRRVDHGTPVVAAAATSLRSGLQERPGAQRHPRR